MSRAESGEHRVKTQTLLNRGVKLCDWNAEEILRMDLANCNFNWNETLTNPDVLAALVPLGILLAVLSTGAIFITVRVLYTIFASAARKVTRQPVAKRIWFRKKPEVTGPSVSDLAKELAMKTSALEEVKAQLEQQQAKLSRRNSELEAEVRSLEVQLVRQREEISVENQRITELRRHAERLETQLEEAVIEVNRIYRNAPGALIGNMSPQPTDQSDATPEQMQKLKEVLSMYTDRLDKQNADSK